MGKNTASHGTLASLAPLVDKDGFKIGSGAGRLGTASYFWSDEDYLFEMAVAWAKYRNTGLKAPEKHGCVYIVNLNYDEAKELLVIDRAIKSNIIKILEKKKLNPDIPKDVTRAYNILISGLNNKNGNKIKLLSGEVSLASKQYFDAGFPYTILNGKGECFAVIDTSVIKIISKTSISL